MPRQRERRVPEDLANARTTHGRHRVCSIMEHATSRAGQWPRSPSCPRRRCYAGPAPLRREPNDRSFIRQRLVIASPSGAPVSPDTSPVCRHFTTPPANSHLASPPFRPATPAVSRADSPAARHASGRSAKLWSRSPFHPDIRPPNRRTATPDTTGIIAALTNLRLPKAKL